MDSLAFSTALNNHPVISAKEGFESRLLHLKQGTTSDSAAFRPIDHVAASLCTIIAGRYIGRRRKRHVRSHTSRMQLQSFFSIFNNEPSNEEKAIQWLKDHPRSGDVLIGWIKHPDLTRNLEMDLEVQFNSSTSGVWHSRSLAFRGQVTATVESPLTLVLSDNASTLRGTVGSADVISGVIDQKGKSGGSFELRLLPKCYSLWWSQVRSQLTPKTRISRGSKSSNEPSDGQMVVVMPGFGDEAPDDKDAESMGANMFGGSPLMDILMGRLNDIKKKKPKEKTGDGLAALKEFTLRPDQVKEYLDRYVIKQTAAKEMLSVAICDHYNRAREELLGIVPGRNVEPELKADEVSKLVGFVKGIASSDSSVEAKNIETTEPSVVVIPPAVKFVDSDGDVIELKYEDECVNEYVNGNLEIPDASFFEIDEADRGYQDETGSGSFTADEDLEKLRLKCEALFKAADAAQIEEASADLKTSTSSSSDSQAPKAAKRTKNYTKPNILLLGPTGSGKTYLLKNLAELIGVPFVKADATKFTETGYVGRDAEDVFRDLLSAAKDDVELAQVGIVYIDEIDKVCGEYGGAVSSFRRGTQSTFLKLLEDTEISIQRGMPQLRMGGGTQMSTRHVLFVFSGAFSQLDAKLKEEHERKSKGFGFEPEAQRDVAKLETQSFLHKAGTAELVKAGLEAEFVGRIPVRVALGALTEDDLYSILADAEDGAASQLIDDFRRYGVELQFTEGALRAVARKAVKEGTGARALVTILEAALRRFKFNVPSLVPRGLSKLEVTETTIEKPDEELERLMASYPEIATALASA